MILDNNSSTSSHDSSDDNNDEPDSDERPVVLILDKLKSPTLSDLHRKRKTKSNPDVANEKVTADYLLIPRVLLLLKE